MPNAERKRLKAKRRTQRPHTQSLAFGIKRFAFSVLHLAFHYFVLFWAGKRNDLLILN